MSQESPIDVSVVIRAKDAESTLAPCLRSVLEQADVSLEAVIVDDASEDDTPQLAARIAAAHPEVRVVTRLIPSTATAAWRDGLTASRGRYACILESVDELAEGALSALFARAEEARADIVCPSIELWRPEEREPLAECDAEEASPRGVDDAGEPRPAPAGDLDEPSFPADGPSEPDEPAPGSPDHRAPRLRQPPATLLTHEAILGAIFVTHDVSCDVRGRLFDRRLILRALAELGDRQLGPGSAEAITFIAACLATRVVGAPDVVSATVRQEASPTELGLDDLGERCQARDAVTSITEFLDRTDSWSSRSSSWMGLAMMLAAKALRPYPRRLDPKDWSEGATLLLKSWGAPFIGAALSSSPADEQALAAIALASAPGFERAAGRPLRILLSVGAFESPSNIQRTLDELSGRGAEVLLVADEHATLPEGLAPFATLAIGRGVLERSRALEEAVRESHADGIVFFAGPDHTLWDLLVARSLGIACGLIVDEPLWTMADDPLAFDAARWITLAGQAAMAEAIAIADEREAPLWRLMGPRVTHTSGLIAQFTLGSPAPQSVAERLCAVRLIETLCALLTRSAVADAKAQAAATELDAQRLVIATRDQTISDLERRIARTSEAPATRRVPTPRRFRPFGFGSQGS